MKFVLSSGIYGVNLGDVPQCDKFLFITYFDYDHEGNPLVLEDDFGFTDEVCTLGLFGRN